MRKPDPKAALYDALDCGIALIDADGRITEWNAWLAAASDVSRKAAIGAKLFDAFPELTARMRSAVAQVFEYGAVAILTHALHPDVFKLRTPAGKRMVHDVTV